MPHLQSPTSSSPKDPCATVRSLSIKLFESRRPPIKNFPFNKILLQGPNVSSLTRLELRHPSEPLSQSLQDSMPSTIDRTTQKGPSITDLPTDAIVGIFDQVKTTRRCNFNDLSNSLVCSCAITRTDYSLPGRANSLINADTPTIGDP